VTDAAPSAPPRRSRGGRALAWLVLLLLLALLGWRGWQHWQSLQHDRAMAARADDAHWRGLEERIDALRRDQRAQAQRIARSDATNRVLRDEVLGIGQRAALLEDSIDKLADPLRRGSATLRLDEVELLLSLGERRLVLAGDLPAAKRAYAMAAGVLAAIDDPALLDLRQALQQEQAELDALDADPKSVALRRLDAFERSLPAPGDTPAPAGVGDRPWWQRAFARIVQVQPSDRAVSVSPGERSAGHAALVLELSLARAAAARRDVEAWRAALARADGWLQRLWPRSPRLEQQRETLAALRDQALSPALPALGSTLAQLRAGRSAR
jgi:uroporphyrin-3 C-methyltransferase